MQTKPILLFICGLFLFVSGALSQAPKSYTSSELLLQLKKLNTVGSVLYIAAHPDDENTRLIAYLANEKCLRTGYLSLTRGDGGQNLIGPEQGVELGIIRTQELLAARRIDGGEQYFTRAYDFGYSKTPEESFEKWNHDSVLGDVVWVIRNFRPDIIITRFATDGSGGHGHHTASAILAEEAFDAAADPNRFPEQLDGGVQVWKTRRLFWNVSTRFQNPKADMSAYIKQDVGGYNPLLGKSYGEIAAESRSMHKSQGFGSAKQRGEYFEYFKPLKGDTVGLVSIFDSMDFSWNRVLGNKGVKEKIDSVLLHFNMENPAASVPELFQLTHAINWEFECVYQHKNLFRLIKQFGGLYTEAIAPRSFYTRGDTIKFSLNGINRSGLKIFEDTRVSACSDYGSMELVLRYPESYLYDSITQSYTLSKELKGNKLNEIKREVIPKFPYERNFFYANGVRNNLYRPMGYHDRHLAEPLLSTMICNLVDFGKFNLNDNNLLTYKWTDPEKGELTRPVIIAPPVLLNLESDLIVFENANPKEIKLVVKAMRDSVKGVLKIAIPEGWFVETKGSNLRKMMDKAEEFGHAFNLDLRGESQEVTLVVYPPAKPSESKIVITALVKGESYRLKLKEIKYDHIPVQTLFTETGVKLVRLDMVLKGGKIGYIPGAGDDVKSCLEQIGYEVTTLTDGMIATGDLNKFKAIVTGIRAYNTNDKLSEYKKKLMDYVANGGNLIVQYNTNSFAGPLKADLGPYKFKLTRERITDENAKVNFELPAHSVLNTPNKITPKDFEGWVQERSIYHAGEWDSSYVAPISMNDPGEKPNKGSLIIAKHGKGNYIYTGLVFFRQLPAGNTGAYRLFVNMIELGTK